MYSLLLLKVIPLIRCWTVISHYYFSYQLKMLLSTCVPVRYIFTILAFVGFVFNYTLRININMVITSMVNHTALNDIHDYKLNSTKKNVSTYTYVKARP